MSETLASCVSFENSTGTSDTCTLSDSNYVYGLLVSGPDSSVRATGRQIANMVNRSGICVAQGGQLTAEDCNSSGNEEGCAVMHHANSVLYLNACSGNGDGCDILVSKGALSASREQEE